MVKRILYIVVCTLLAVSCSTSRKSLRNTMIGGLTGVEYMEKVLDISPSRSNITAKASVEISCGDKEPLRFNSNIRIRRGEVIRFSVAPMLGIEVARVDITPDGILAVDRLHKRYVKAGFDELSSLVNTDLNFNILQSLFMNELFLPGKYNVNVTDAEKFNLNDEEGRVRLDVKSSKEFEYSFYTQPDDGSLKETVISLKNTDFSIHCKYDDFTMLKDDLFPQKIRFSAEGFVNPYMLDMKLSRIGTDSDWDSKTELTSKYKKIPLAELVKILIK